MTRGDSDFRVLVDRALSEMYATGAMEQILAQAIPNLSPGLALQALYMIAPIVK